MNTEIITSDEDETLIKCVINRITPKAYVTKNVDGERIHLSKQYTTIVDKSEGGVAEVSIPNWLAVTTGIL